MKLTVNTRYAAVASVLLYICVILPGCGLTDCVPIEDQSEFNSEDTLVIAHRGGAGLWPENTLFAFQEVVALGVDVLEMDLRETQDGVLIIMHDPTVDRTTDGTGPVDSLTLEELQSLDAGYWWTNDEGITYPFRDQNIMIPTLYTVLAEFPSVRLNIEIKITNPTAIESFCTAIRENRKTAEVLVVSSDADTIIAFRNSCPEVATATSESEVQEFFISTLLPFLGNCLAPAIAVQVPEFSGDIHVVTNTFVDAVHDNNVMIHVWTINESVDIQRFLDLGVDGIISDFPDRVLDLLGRTAL